MNETIELLNFIYETSEMGKNSLETTLTLIKEKDNKIKNACEDILKNYKNFFKESGLRLSKLGVKGTKAPFITKMGTMTGIKKEISNDNSDASIAGMIIQGLTMGVTYVSVKISNYDKIVNKKDLKLANEFLSFQEEAIEKLKKYL